MKVMTMWSAKPGAIREAVARFLAGEGTPPDGVTLLGRWHSVDLSAGLSLYELTDPAPLYEGAARWADVLDLKSYMVIEDVEAGTTMARVFRK